MHPSFTHTSCCVGLYYVTRQYLYLYVLFSRHVHAMFPTIAGFGGGGRGGGRGGRGGGRGGGFGGRGGGGRGGRGGGRGGTALLRNFHTYIVLLMGDIYCNALSTLCIYAIICNQG